MAQVKITDLTAYADPKSTDALAAVDVTANVTKKVDIAAINKNAALGSAALPGMAFDGDPDTGVFSLGPNQAALATGGTGRLFIDASGAVTIPGTLSTNGTNTAASFIPTSSTAPTNGLYLSATNQVALATNGTGRLFIDASGNVGVGVSSLGQKFQIATGNVQLDTGYGLLWDDATTGIFGNRTSSFIHFYTNNTERLRITAAGLVGIGTSAPTNYGAGINNISINGSAGGIADFYFNGIRQGWIGTLASNQMVVDTAGAAIPLTLRTNGNAALTIDTSQRVGIGTTSPQQDFHINDATGVSRIRLTGGAASADNFEIGQSIPGVSNSGFSIYDVDEAASRFVISSSGNVGIGTSVPQSRLEVNDTGVGSVVIPLTVANQDTSSSGTGAGIGFVVDGVNDVIGAQIAGVRTGSAYHQSAFVISTRDQSGGGLLERLRITAAGLVGIGTSSPGEKLDVYAGSLSVGSHYVSTLNTDYKMRLRSVGAATNNNYLVEIGATGSGPQPSDSDLTLATQTWNGSAYVTTEKARLTATGRLGIGTTSPAQLLHLKGSGDTKLLLNSANNTSDRGIYFATSTDSEVLGYIKQEYSTGQLQISSGTGSYASDVAFRTAGSERAKIDISGRLLVGTSTARSNFYNTSTIAPSLQVEGTTYGSSSLSLIANGNAAAGNPVPIVLLGRTRGTSVGSTTVVSAGDSLGSVSYQGSDGTEFVEAASIAAEVDGTPGANNMPGRIVLSTTAAGSASPTERLRIDSTGLMTLAGPGIKFPATQVASSDPNTLDDYEEGTWTPGQGTGVTVVGTYSSVGRYTKIGRVVNYEGYFSGSTSVAFNPAGGNLTTGLPFSVVAGSGTNGSAVNGSATVFILLSAGGTVVSGSASIAATSTIYFSGQYIV